jgi:hypothetical protein
MVRFASHAAALALGAALSAGTLRSLPTPVCRVQGMLPDPACTPGAVLTTDAQIICQPGYAGSVRNVSDATKRQVYAAYGIVPRSNAYEIDHLISLELGGSNEVDNLWPESYGGAQNARDKDRLENEAHRLVCAEQLPLEEAQQKIAQNWVQFSHDIMVKETPTP